MYKRIDFTKLEGIALTQDLLNFLQTSYRDAIAAVSLFFGDLVIVSGVVNEGSNYSDGWVAIAGELLPITGGLIATNIIIEETTATEEFGDGTNKTVYYTRRAKLSSSGGWPVSSFVRISTAKSITTDRLLKAGDTMSGALAMGTNKITGLANGTNAADAVNKSQLDAAINNLISGAPGVLDTLQEIAAALDNDPDFVDTINNLINEKVDKAGDTITGTLEVQGGIRTKSTGPYLKTEVITIGDWNMYNAGGGSDNKVVPHGIANYKKIREISVVIRNDADDRYYSFKITNQANYVDATDVYLNQVVAGTSIFSFAGFSATSYNRGWITITYEA